MGEKVAELARLPWVSKRVAVNPAKGFTPCASSHTGDFASVQPSASKECSGHPRDNHLPILKGFNHWR